MSDIWGNATSSTRVPPPSDKYGQIAADITVLIASIKELSDMINNLGTNKDGRALRKNLATKREDIHRLVTKTKAQLQKPYEPNEKPKHDKLSQNFNSVLTEYEQLVKQSLKKEREIASFIEERRSLKDMDPIERDKGMSKYSDLQQLKLSEVEEAAIIDEQNKAMQEIERDLNELAECFVDMAETVKVGGEMLNQAENNTQKAEVEADEGGKEIVEANSLLNKARVKIIIIVISVLVLLFILILGLALGLKGK